MLRSARIPRSAPEAGKAIAAAARSRSQVAVDAPAQPVAFRRGVVSVRLCQHVNQLGRTVANLANNERRRLRRKASATARLGDDIATVDRYPGDLTALLQIEPRVRCLLYLAFRRLTRVRDGGAARVADQAV
jgi:hypothetical protein